MVPYLGGFFQIISPSGECIEIFNTCRAKANFLKENRTWGREFVEDGIWEGYCNWAWDEGDYDIKDDPWYDPLNPASTEVAGFVVDPPDSDGHGFYLEPSGSKRIREANNFEPLEMFFTGTIVSCTSRGEAYLLKWLDKQLSNCDAACQGWEAQVFSHYTCVDEFSGIVIDECGNLDYSGTVLGEPERPEQFCCEAEDLKPGGVDIPFYDTGSRKVRKIIYKGFEQLEEGLDECKGNRYKFCFEVKDHCWIKTGIKLPKFSAELDECGCFCTDKHNLCVEIEEQECAENNFTGFNTINNSITVNNSRPATDSRKGLIAIPGRYVRPDKVRVQALLTPILSGDGWVPAITINNLGADSYNFRVGIWPALDNVPPPDTEEGWCVYRGLEYCMSADIHVLREGQAICLNPDQTCDLICAGGAVVSGDPVVEKYGKELDCDGRYWIVLEGCCEQPNDFDLDIVMHQVEPI